MNKNTDKRDRLIKLGAECLADALLELTIRYQDAEDMVERLTSTPQENIKRFRAKLAGLKRRRRFLRAGQSSGFAEELKGLLQDLQAGVHDPQSGVDLVAAFYETDDAIFKQCDDSYGNIGDIFRIDAQKLFVSYASGCENKDGLTDLILKLNRDDGYGVRDSLFNCASDYLPESAMRKMVERLWELSQKEAEEYTTRHWVLDIESLARQLKDAPLFEKARLALWPELSTAACVDIAEAYLESGDAKTALTWLEKIPDSEHFQAYERDKLLLAIHKRLGNQDKLEETAWRIFRRYRSKDTLADLLEAIGKNQGKDVIEAEARMILQSDQVSYSDADFLIQSGRIDDAETYLLNRADQLDGDLYTHLLPLAEHMEKEERCLTASVVYRALLDSILGRAQSKYYTHGVRYLKKLDALATQVHSWQDILSHDEYAGELRQVHGRKKSFWSRYEK